MGSDSRGLRPAIRFAIERPLLTFVLGVLLALSWSS